MEALFLKILSLSLGATYVAAAVIALRFLLKRTPKWIVCAMWGLVAIRLLCPFTLESAVSLAPSPDFRPVPLISANQPEAPAQTPRPSAAQPAQAGAVQTPTESPAQVPASAPAEIPEESQTPTQSRIALFARVWLLGVAGMLGYLIFSTLRLRRRVGVSIPMAEKVRCSESVDTPFVLGVFRPTIYLPASASPEDIPYVLAHERTHIRRRDHWWKPLGFVLLSVYWFNPVLWLAYVLLCRDIEAACDERVIRDMAAEGRRAYSTALLHCSVSRDAIAACPLAFGETGVKERIRAVASYKKPAFWTILAGIVLGIVIGVCFLTSPETAGIKPKDITPQGMTLQCRRASRLEITDCRLEYQDGAQWKTVARLGSPMEPDSTSPMEPDISFRAEDRGWQVDWSVNYGMLLPGTYRLSLTCTDLDTGESLDYPVEFNQKSSGVYLWQNTDDLAVDTPQEATHILRVPGREMFWLTVDEKNGERGVWNDLTGENLFLGDVRSVAFADMNGDGVCEVYGVANYWGEGDAKIRDVCCYDLATKQKYTLQGNDADFNTLLVRDNRLYLMQQWYPENVQYGVSQCYRLALTDNGLETQELDRAGQAMTTQLVEMETCGLRWITMNSQQMAEMGKLLQNLKGHVQPASPEALTQALENPMSVHSVKLNYTLGYRVLNFSRDYSLIWEDGSESAYVIADPEPLRTFLTQLTDGVRNWETSGTPFAGDEDAWKWMSGVTVDAISSAKANVCLEYVRTGNRTSSSVTAGSLNRQTLEQLFAILNEIPQDALSAGKPLTDDSFRDAVVPYSEEGCGISLLDGVNHLAIGISWTKEETAILITSQTEQYDARWSGEKDTLKAHRWVIQDEKLDAFLEDFWKEPPVIFYTVGAEYDWQTPVKFRYEDFSLNLNLIEGWVYEEVPFNGESTGVRCRPGDETTGWLYFSYWPEGYAPVETDRYISEGYWDTRTYTSFPASAETEGTRDAIWSYLGHRSLGHGDYVVINQGADGWFRAYSDQILDTTTLADAELGEAG